MGMTTMTLRPNKYDTTCHDCGQRVPAGRGHLIGRIGNRWVVTHADGNCPAAKAPTVTAPAADPTDALIRRYADLSAGATCPEGCDPGNWAESHLASAEYAYDLAADDPALLVAAIARLAGRAA